MKLLSSLRSRIFLASALLAVLPIAAAIYVVNDRVTDQTEKALYRQIQTTGTLVDQLRATETEIFRTLARLIANEPYLRAAVATDDPKTVESPLTDIVAKYGLTSRLLIVTNRSGRVLATIGASGQNALAVAGQPAVHNALAGGETTTLLPQPEGILEVITVPIELVTITTREIIGTLSIGFPLDNSVAAQLEANSGSDIAFGMSGEILASTVPSEHRSAMAGLLRQTTPSRAHIGTNDYLVLSRPLATHGDTWPAGSDPTVLILRSRANQQVLLQSIRQGLGATAIIAAGLAALLSFAVARTITRPLAAITDVMREVAATGDLTRKIAFDPGRRWDDEDARLLATTYNTLTDSIARFQREVSQKERLSSLGRLSTVIAHEVRNPLMIIKASLHALGQPDIGPSARREAIADIDEEVARLNRLVNEVLDFARPIRFEWTPTDLNALCRESAAAAEAASGGPPIRVTLDQDMGRIDGDPERLRLALVNLLVNARQAVQAREVAPEPVLAGTESSAAGIGSGTVEPRDAEDPPPILLKTIRRGEIATILITDLGIGIDPADLPRVFDPYFTTKRGGTGLGLAIARNIIEGLGGTIRIMSTPGQGTDVFIDLPAAKRLDHPPEAAA
jgi:signal transduction histidine kinase